MAPLALLKSGWNTWNVRSVLSHVHLPEGFAIALGLKTYDRGCCLREALIGRKSKTAETIVPGPHAYDGSYTSLELTCNRRSARSRFKRSVIGLAKRCWPSGCSTRC